MTKTLLSRSEVDKSLTWDLSAIFNSEEDYQVAVKQLLELTDKIEKQFKGKLHEATIINACIDEMKTVYELQSRTYNYVQLAVSVDQTNTDNLSRYMNLMNIMSSLNSRLSFVQSEIVNTSEDMIKEAMNQSQENALFLKEIMDFKKHVLHPEVERVLSALSSTLNSPYSIYEQAKLADMDFGSFEVDGINYPLSFGLYEDEYEYDSNTNVRRTAFNVFSNKLKEYQNTIASVYQTQIQKEKTMATLRGFDSVFDHLLFPQKVDRSLYNRQIDLITEKLAPHMRKYAKLLKRIHKLDEMTFADLKIDVDPEFEPSITVEESKEYIKGALSVLGDDYLDIISRSYDERWIDFAQNKGKSTGAFCASPYGVHPYVLVSWTSMMREVFTLSHELGHAGQAVLTNNNQNILNTDTSMYFVEAPSTMNEMLMANYLMKKNHEPRFKRWVLSSIISRTYYHNFVTHLLEAAYQREVYKIIDNGGSIHAQKLNEIKRNVLEKFWGDTVNIVDGAELTWMRQPHYYMGLYPYTYSAGLTIATEVSKRILNDDKEAIEDWKEVLKAGGTKTPVELAKMAGVDITTEKPLLDTIEHIGNMIDEIISLTDEIEKNS